MLPLTDPFTAPVVGSSSPSRYCSRVCSEELNLTRLDRPFLAPLRPHARQDSDRTTTIQLMYSVVGTTYASKARIRQNMHQVLQTNRTFQGSFTTPTTCSANHSSSWCILGILYKFWSKTSSRWQIPIPHFEQFSLVQSILRSRQLSGPTFRPLQLQFIHYDVASCIS